MAIALAVMSGSFSNSFIWFGTRVVQASMLPALMSCTIVSVFVKCRKKISSILGLGPHQVGLATMRMCEFFFHSMHLKGPEPTIGGGFWKFFDRVLAGHLDQTCSGRIGTQWRIMSGLGFEQVNSTV